MMADLLTANQIEEFGRAVFRVEPVYVASMVVSNSFGDTTRNLVDRVIDWGDFEEELFNVHPTDQGTLIIATWTIKVDNSDGVFDLGDRAIGSKYSNSWLWDGAWGSQEHSHIETGTATLELKGTFDGLVIAHIEGQLLEPEYENNGQVAVLTSESKIASIGIRKYSDLDWSNAATQGDTAKNISLSV